MAKSPISFEYDPYNPNVSRRPQNGQTGYDSEKEALRQRISQQEATLAEQNNVIKSIMAPPFVRMVVLSEGRQAKKMEGQTGSNAPLEDVQATVVIGAGGQELEVVVPPKMILRVGCTVRVNAKTMSIVEVCKEPEQTPNGVIQVIAGILDEATAEVEVGTGGRRVVQTNHTKVEKGDRVLMDVAGNYVLKNLGKQNDDFKAEIEKINIPWEAIGGQKLAKTEMQEAIEGPITHREIFAAYGKKPVKGVLLFGPPGCGKTLLAKAAATSLAKLHGKTSATGFIYVKGPEILNKWVGQSEETIRNLFSRARDHFKREGYPAVLFIDEADAVLGARGSNGSINGMEKTIVPMFLAEMDGLDENGPLVLLATNRSDSLDPAVVRDGRVDRKIEVTRPNLEDSKEIFQMYLKGKPLSGLGIETFAQAFSTALFASPLKMRACGALIAGLVEQAISLAMRRDIALGLKTATGLTMEDIGAAVKAVESQNLKVQNG